MPVSGWFSSCASDAAISPMIATRLKCTSSSWCRRASASACLRAEMSTITAQNQRTFGASNRADSDLDREFGSVFVSNKQFSSRSPRTRYWRRKELRPIGLVRSAESFRHQDFDFLPDEIVTPIAEDVLGPRIDQHYLILLVCQDDRIRGGFQYQAHTFFALAQRSLRSPSAKPLHNQYGDQGCLKENCPGSD